MKLYSNIPFALLALCGGLLFSKEHDWRFTTGDWHGFRAENWQSATVQKEVGFVGVGEKEAYLFTPPLQLDPRKYQVLELDMETENPHVTIYFSRPDAPFAPARGVSQSIGRGRQRIRFDFRNNKEWRDTINGLRIDAVTKAGLKTTIRRIRLRPAPSASANLMRNGDFTDDLESWEGTATLSDAGVVLPSHGKLVSCWTDIPLPQKLCLETVASPLPMLTIHYRDIYGQRLLSQQLAQVARQQFTPPSLAAEYQLEMQAGETPVQLSGVSLKPVTETGRDWKASWLYAPEEKKHTNSQMLFQHRFDVTDCSNLQRALLQITGDDYVAACLNGVELIGQNADSWSTPDVHEVGKYLKERDNLLTCQVINGTGPGGLLAEISLVYPDNRVQTIGTSSEWRCTVLPRTEPWKNAKAEDTPEVIGPAGCSPWSTIPYVPPSSVKIVLQGLTAPATADEDTVWNMTPVLRSVGNAEPLRIGELLFSVHITQGTHSLLVADVAVSGEDLADGKEVRLNCPPVFFKYLPAGQYQVVPTLSRAFFGILRRKPLH
ncbi:MAG: hypothetical protein IJJ33_08460 [Victivallales bacterium]|nr:hypothetical protein [Victivallales bacterium]